MGPFDTVYPSDSVEFCPHPHATDIFVCGTYQLQDSPQNLPGNDDENLLEPQPSRQQQHRVGKCLVFRVDSPENDTFSQIQEISLPAVLDMKWCHTTPERQPVLGIADSEGHITIHEWDLQTKQINSQFSVDCATSDVLCLSLDWSNRRMPTNTVSNLVVSLSNGHLSWLQPNPIDGLIVASTWPAHDYEPWIAAWNYWDTNIIYSGGDDLQLKAWDLRQGFSNPFLTNKRFDAGITSIQSHPHVEHIIAVGSYDSTVRLFDTRKLLTPLTQAEVGGGAWRIKWHPSPARDHDLLVAAMHDGFKIVQFCDIWAEDPPPIGGENWDIAQTFDKHTSLAYGVDWSFAEEHAQPGKTLVASASFYDHALHTWRG
ncbi:WD-40 repeat-containing protein [Amylostereum chailletii]|nr:WD-40 repeat-containing protein [Amylostereum chailletii]